MGFHLIIPRFPLGRTVATPGAHTFGIGLGSYRTRPAGPAAGIFHAGHHDFTPAPSPPSVANERGLPANLRSQLLFFQRGSPQWPALNRHVNGFHPPEIFPGMTCFLLNKSL